METVAVSLELGALDLDQATAGRSIEIISENLVIVREKGRD